MSSKKRVLTRLISLVAIALLLHHISDFVPKVSGAILEGRLSVGADEFIARCDCSGLKAGLSTTAYSRAMCNPTKIAIISDHGKSGSSIDAIRKLYGQLTNLALADISTVPVKCMDSRPTEPQLMVPGGNVGEFLLGLHVLTTFLDSKQSAVFTKMIPEIFAEFAHTRFKNVEFSYCTDKVAYEKLQRAMKYNCEARESATNIACIQTFISDPVYHGDVHIRSILSNPDRYHTSPELVNSVLSAVLHSISDESILGGQKIHMDIFSDALDAQAFIELDEGRQCIAAARSIPLQPRMIYEGRPMSSYIVHSGVMRSQRIGMAQFLTTSPSIAGLIASNGIVLSHDKILSRLEKYGLEWLEATVDLNFRDLNFYTLHLI